MTKKDYVLIAGVVADWVRYATADNERVQEAHALNLIDSLAIALERDNPRFNVDRFVVACGVNGEGKLNR